MNAAWWSFGEWTLLDPAFLLLAPLLVLTVLWRRARHGAALPTAHGAFAAALPRTLRARAVHLPLWLLLLAGVCLVLAMARPVAREVMPLREQGIDICLVVDISSSMLIDDMDERLQVRRIDAARSRAQDFAKARVHDRVGLVTFARLAELRCPLTLDEQALQAFLAAIETVPQNSQELDGTSVGTGLAKAVKVLEEADSKSRVIVLLTDGKTTVEGIEAQDAAKLAKDSGIKVHTIGLGNGVPTPLGWQPTDFDELREVARITGGEFFQPRSDADLAKVYERIDELEKVGLDDPRYRLVDGFAWPLGIGLILLAVSLLLEVFWIRRVP